jgi:hypothetical protein
MMPNNNNKKLALELYFKFHHLQLGHKRTEMDTGNSLQQKPNQHQPFSLLAIGYIAKNLY